MEHTQQHPAPAPAQLHADDDWRLREPSADESTALYDDDQAAFERWKAEQRLTTASTELAQRLDARDELAQRLGYDGPPPVERPAPVDEAAPPPVTGEFVSRVELPSGGWAEIADPRKIRAKHRKRVMDHLNVDRMKAGKAGVAFDMTDGLILMMVEKWHLPYLPGIGRPLDDPASVDELTIPDYDRLIDALGPAQEMIFPRPATVDGAKTPGSPTPPGGA